MAIPSSVIKHLMAKVCCKLQSPVFHILLMQPNINSVTQATHVGINLLLVGSCNLKDQVQTIVAYAVCPALAPICPSNVTFHMPYTFI